MAERIAFEVNEETRTVEVAPDTPLLYVLRNELGSAKKRSHVWRRQSSPGYGHDVWCAAA